MAGQVIERPLRIIFMGTPDFAASNLQALLAGPDNIVAVVTQPDKPKGRGKKLSPPPVKVLAEEENIPVLQPTKIRTDEFRDELAAYQPDLIVVVAYGRILPKSLLELPPLGCINLHGSILPRHRGAAPIQWAVIAGDKEVGVTVIQMDEGMDTGDILLKSTIQSAPGETAGTLFKRLAKLGTTALLDAIKGLKTGTIEPETQDHSQATEAPMLKKDDGLVDWNKTADEIECLIRGLDPWPNAFSFINGKRIKFFVPEVYHQDSGLLPGTVVRATKDGLLVAAATNCVLIKEVQLEGKKRMPVEALINGFPIEPGTVLQGNIQQLKK